jgi:hypothetical protein
MNIEAGRMVPLGYGKYFRSDRIVGLEPIEAGRGPGQRTKVYVEQLATPLIASRSEGAILSDMVELPRGDHQNPGAAGAAKRSVGHPQRD